MRGNAKGLLFGHLEEFAKTTSGPDAYKKTIASLEREDREILEGLVLASGWYPVGTWNRALDTYLKTYHSNPKKGMDAFSVLLGDRELTGLVKFVLKLGSPEFMLKRTNFLWNRYFDQGTFAAEEIGPKHFRLTLEGPVDENLGPSRYNCAQGAAPWLTRGLQLAGCANGKVDHLKCRFDGGGRCEFRATW